MAALWPRPLAKSIMNKLITQCLALVVLLFISQFSYAQQGLLSEALFNQQAFEQVKAQHQGTKWLILLWSVD